MNYLKKTFFSIATLTLIFALQSVDAQDIDKNRMQRDINIMENILQEMFKTSWEARGNSVRIQSNRLFRFERDDDINGTYVPGYGVIFTVPGGPPGFVLSSDADDDGFAYSFQYGDDQKEVKVTQETVTNKIVEFLRDYGSTMGQLSNGDRITVIYKANTPRFKLDVIQFSNNKKIQRQQIPTISVVATQADLQSYRRGNLSDAEFRNRLEISTADAEENQQMDLKVMANIFDTAFKETDDEQFYISGSVDYVMLKNFGALFSFNITQGNNFSDLAKAFRGVAENLASVLDADSAKVKSISINHNDDASDNKVEKEARQDLDEFISNLKAYIIDYGPTLRSVESDQQVLISITVNATYGSLPDRIDLQVSKSTLERINQGAISREQAIEQIQVRKY